MKRTHDARTSLKSSWRSRWKPVLQSGFTCSLVILSALLLGSSQPPPVQRIEWANLKAAGQFDDLEAELVEADPGFTALRIESQANEPQIYSLFELEDPPLTQFQWRVEGQIRYQDVEGDAYLELMNHFESGSFFSRSLADGGPLQKIHGSSEWRSFTLPFDASTGGALGEGEQPERLEFNLVLPSRGVVEIGPVELYEGSPAGHWWSDRTGGLVGGLLGSGIGIMGAIIGTLVGFGRARGLVLILCRLTITLGGILLMVGIYAVATGQPYAVFYPLVLTGVISLGVFGVNYPIIVMSYRQRELRQMQAQDLST